MPSVTQDDRHAGVQPLPIPGDHGDDHGDDHGEGAIEVPASRSSIADGAKYMHSLSAVPSMKDRRGSRNSFGASLPIPRRASRQSRLSSVASSCQDGGRSRPGMPPTHSTRALLAAQVQTIECDKVNKAKNMAFAFDIDGVLVHGDRLIPEARKALEILNGDNELGIKIPHIFLTNGSGKPEPARCEQLSQILGQPVAVDQFIQSHTPMSALAEYYQTVLVVGGEGSQCREVAAQYGFQDIVVPNDLLAADSTIAPYRVFTDAERRRARPRDFSHVAIQAILVFSDSRDYATDMQICMDLLQAEHGRLGTRAADPVAQRIPIYFSQGDLLCPTEHAFPRMSQGAFRIGLEAMYKALVGVDLERVVYGKPEPAAYRFADEVLAAWTGALHGGGGGEERLPARVYMVGDNPASDIVGGNLHGWHTCLVRTGVFQGGANDENNPASFGVFPNVLDAVQTALRKELGPNFKMHFDDSMNPLHAEGNHAVEEIW